VVAYDEVLASRIREQLAGVDAVTEKKMFGGLAFLVNGTMAVAASGQGGLLLRVSEDFEDEPHAEPFVMRGKAMEGWLRVTEEGCVSEPELARWVAAALKRRVALAVLRRGRLRDDAMRRGRRVRKVGYLRPGGVPARPRLRPVSTQPAADVELAARASSAGGVLPSQRLREAVQAGWVTSVYAIAESSIQPASIDLRLGRKALRLRCSTVAARR
jgi:TfoX/Sxy family transcriptional regulator of competence genes